MLCPSPFSFLSWTIWGIRPSLPASPVGASPPFLVALCLPQIINIVSLIASVLFIVSPFDNIQPPFGHLFAAYYPSVLHSVCSQLFTFPQPERETACFSLSAPVSFQPTSSPPLLTWVQQRELSFSHTDGQNFPSLLGQKFKCSSSSSWWSSPPPAL